MELPRTLIVSSTRLGTQSATGVAMASLFGGWPKDRLAQLHSDHYSEFDRGVCEQYFALHSRIDKLRRLPVVGPRAVDWFGGNGRFAQWVNYRDALAWCRSFEPDVVYLRLVDQPTCFRWLPHRLADDLGMPIVTHLMDDWPARFAAGASKADVDALHARLVSLFGRAKANLSISDKMARDFGVRYGVPFKVFHNAIDHEEWQGIARRRSAASDGVFRLVYSGSLADDMCLRSAIDLAKAVAALRAEGRSIEWDVHTAPWWREVFRQHLSQHDGVKEAGFLPRRDYLQALADADLLALPINFDKRSLTYVRYSMSNKAPEYMAARSPILAYGPLESATIEYAQALGWAHVVGEQSVDRLTSELRTLMDDADRRATLADVAHRVGMARHDAATNRQLFRSVIAGAASCPPISA